MVLTMPVLQTQQISKILSPMVPESHRQLHPAQLAHFNTPSVTIPWVALHAKSRVLASSSEQL